MCVGLDDACYQDCLLLESIITATALHSHTTATKMTTGQAITLLPPPIDLTLDNNDSLPQCTANLMPFSIDYDGPAPIDAFLVQRRADPSSSSSGGGESVTGESVRDSFMSAFRGRAMQSTPLALPKGYVAKVACVAQVVERSSGGGGSGGGGAVAVGSGVDEAEREKKRRRTAKQPPARQQKFSMDSDDDDDDVHSIHAASPPPPQSTETQPAAGSTPPRAGATIHITPIAQVHPNHLTVWGPDGPIDKGDDAFFRTIGEWYNVVVPLVSLRSSPFTSLCPDLFSVERVAASTEQCKGCAGDNVVVHADSSLC